MHGGFSIGMARNGAPGGADCDAQNRKIRRRVKASTGAVEPETLLSRRLLEGLAGHADARTLRCNLHFFVPPEQTSLGRRLREHRTRGSG
jgi:hypothetical protein